MRQCYILLLAVVTLVSSVDAGLATSSSKFPVLVAGDQVDSVAKRFLSVETDEDKGDDIDSDEEKGVMSSSFAQKLKNLPMSSIQKVKDTVSQVRAEFKFLSLELDVWGGLGSPDMMKWADSVAKLFKYDTEKTAKVMLTTMKRHFDEFTVAMWAYAAKDSIPLGNYARNLQLVQFTKWKKAGLDAPGLAKMLKTTATSRDSERDKLIVEALAAFLKTHTSA